MITAQIPKGFRDFLPEKMAVRQKIISQMIAVFESFGFDPLDTPCLEYAETLEGKYGEEGEKLIYRFEDRGGRMVALRYDLTIPLSRVIAMHPTITKPFKRYQIAPVWRADKPQKGRFREFYQCDIDIVGCDSAYADAELIIITFEVLHTLGFQSFNMRINNRKVLNAFAKKSGIADEAIALFLRALDKLDKIGPDGVMQEMRTNSIVPGKEQEKKILQMLHAETTLDDIAEYVRGVLEGDEGISEMHSILSSLAAHGVPAENYQFDLSLARGLDYYTGPIFETVVREPSIGSITGGGRYDNLIGLYTKQPVAATGTSFGLERLVTVLEETGKENRQYTKTQVLITVFDSTLMNNNLIIAKNLRQAGIHTEVYFSQHKLKKQLTYASNRSIPIVLILGPDELQEKKITLRNMQKGLQETIPHDDLIKAVKKHLA